MENDLFFLFEVQHIIAKYFSVENKNTEESGNRKSEFLASLLKCQMDGNKTADGKFLKRLQEVRKLVIQIPTFDVKKRKTKKYP